MGASNCWSCGRYIPRDETVLMLSALLRVDGRYGVGGPMGHTFCADCARTGGVTEFCTLLVGGDYSAAKKPTRPTQLGAAAE